MPNMVVLAHNYGRSRVTKSYERRSPTALAEGGSG